MVLHKNIRGPVQVQSKMMVQALKKFIEFFMKKNSVAHKRHSFFAGKKKGLGQAKGWDNVMVEIGNGKRENLVI